MNETLLVACAHCNALNRVARDRLDQSPTCGNCREPLLPPRPIELTDANFDRVVGKGDLPVVVDFWAAWCGPCKAMAPAFEQAAATLAPHVRLGKLDTEAASAIAGRYGIRSIPTLVAFAGGREIARQSGAMPLPHLLQWIRSHVPQS